MPLATAREKARIAAGKLIDKGDDPAAAKSEQHRLKVVSDLATDYVNLHARPSKKTWPRDQWILDKDVLPTLGHVPVRDVTRQHIQRLLDPIRDPKGRNAPEAAAGHRNTATWLRLILLTGQRPGEVLAMRWDALDIFAPGRKWATAGLWDVKTSKNGDPINAALSREAVRVLRSWRDHSEREHARIERNMRAAALLEKCPLLSFPPAAANEIAKMGRS